MDIGVHLSWVTFPGVELRIPRGNSVEPFQEGLDCWELLGDPLGALSYQGVKANKRRGRPAGKEESDETPEFDETVAQDAVEDQ